MSGTPGGPDAPCRFTVGTEVRVRPDSGEFTRTPAWAHDRIGRIVRDIGVWPEPESVARGDRGAPPRRLYHVVFPGDVELAADIYEHWLEPGPGG